MVNTARPFSSAITSLAAAIIPSALRPCRIDEVRDPTGAGDSFAGGFMGYLASQGEVNRRVLRHAMFYGSVMGSFAVERFGTERLQSLTREEIDRALQHLPRIDASGLRKRESAGLAQLFSNHTPQCAFQRLAFGRNVLRQSIVDEVLVARAPQRMRALAKPIQQDIIQTDGDARLA